MCTRRRFAVTSWSNYCIRSMINIIESLCYCFTIDLFMFFLGIFQLEFGSTSSAFCVFYNNWAGWAITSSRQLTFSPKRHGSDRKMRSQSFYLTPHETYTLYMFIEFFFPIGQYRIRYISFLIHEITSI